MEDQGKPENTEEVIQCRHCDREISAKAKICWHCGNYKGWWRNKLKYVGIFTALAMVVISVVQVVFITIKTVDTYKVLDEIDSVKTEATTVLTSIQNSEKLLNEKLGTLSLNIDALEGRLSENTESFNQKQEELAGSIEAVKLQAEKMVSDVVDSVNLQASSSKKRLADTEKTFDTKQKEMNDELAVLRDDLSGQLKKLQWRDKLMQLVDGAISEGSRADLNEILKIRGETQDIEKHNIVSSYMFQIKKFFLYVDRYKGRKLTKTVSGTMLVPAETDTQELINYATTQASAGVRYLFVRELSKRKEIGVPEALILVIQKDESLDVLAAAINSFEAVTDYQSRDVFDDERAIKYWNENKEEIKKKLKKPENSTEKSAS